MSSRELWQKLKIEKRTPALLETTRGEQYLIEDSSNVFITHREVVIGMNPDESGVPQNSVLLNPIHIIRFTQID